MEQTSFGSGAVAVFAVDGLLDGPVRIGLGVQADVVQLPAGITEAVEHIVGRIHPQDLGLVIWRKSYGDMKCKKRRGVR